jgi:YVTN family beta-propeller protein
MIALLLLVQQIATPNVGPFGAKVSPDGATVLVPEFGQFSPEFIMGSTVAVIDVGNDAVVGTVAVDLQPEDVDYTPDGSYAFVTNAGAATVSVIEMASLTTVASIPCGVPFATFLFGVSVSPDGKLGYVGTTGGNWDGSEENLYVFDADPTSANFATVLYTIEITGGFTRGAFRNGGKFVTARGFADNDFGASPRVSQFKNGALVGEAIVHPATAGFHGSEDIAVTPNGRYAYVPVWEFLGGTDEVFVVDLNLNTVVDIVRLGSGDDAQHGIAIDPSGLLVPTTNFFANSVSVIFTPTNTVIQQIPVGAQPNEVAFTPDGLKAYVTNQGSNTVSVLTFAPRHELVVQLAQNATVDPQIAKPLAAHIKAVQNNPAALASLVNFIREKSAQGLISIGENKDTVPPAEDVNNVGVTLGGVGTYTTP